MALGRPLGTLHFARSRALPHCRRICLCCLLDVHRSAKFTLTLAMLVRLSCGTSHGILTTLFGFSTGLVCSAPPLPGRLNVVRLLVSVDQLCHRLERRRPISPHECSGILHSVRSYVFVVDCALPVAADLVSRFVFPCFPHPAALTCLYDGEAALSQQFSPDATLNRARPRCRLTCRHEEAHRTLAHSLSNAET